MRILSAYILVQVGDGGAGPVVLHFSESLFQEQQESCSSQSVIMVQYHEIFYMWFLSIFERALNFREIQTWKFSLALMPEERKKFLAEWLFTHGSVRFWVLVSR